MRFAFALLAAALAATPSAAQQNCAAVFKYGIYDQGVSWPDKDIALWMSDRAEASEIAGDGGNAALGIGAFGAKIAAERKAEREAGPGKPKTNIDHLRAFTEAKDASQIVLKAFKDCVAQPGLHFWVEYPQDERLFRIKGLFRSPTNTNREAAIFVYGNTQRCRPGSANNRYYVTNAPLSLLCDRLDPFKPSTVAINATYLPTVASFSIAPAVRPPQSIRLFVSAKQHSAVKEWLKTGIKLVEGMILEIEAKGEAMFMEASATTKSGPGGHPFTCEGDPSALNCGALIGRIGNGKPFVVGSKYSALANASGELQLAYQDVDWENNAGGYEVWIAAKPR